MTTIGVLALQGDVREHMQALSRIGVTPVGVRRVRELEAVEGLVIPGGESTTIDKLLRIFELYEPLRTRLAEGLPVLGTCAGMIMLATDIIGGIEGQQTLGAIPMTVRRNAFGRQVDSSEVQLTWRPDGSTMHATFIRAPWVESFGDDVEVLAVDEAHGDRTVAVRHGNAIATSFHPEIVAPGAVADDRVHALLAEIVAAR
ncbi:pyridoxal 5'-phosphate synthase glutaminase subunit PdxT [Demequina capsici]|uniref:Pyridoxal 5'-phosphate synthase subunit PdxT n=1 Tax=Demequina capsici TaxID=3075620 RepID=A0AA96FFS9_9MICO|nr:MULTISPECIES: pyridoxal 5'-phosphate synthase glutaminase subunit PdxT [unclassified Demequina]WNM25747.1 pyridoxal 5'-phosphate synthase glutaminase subunit PdxT [Demequina sp. OYTSA14]WNM28642.1 pyridoxal 5'-phosphate synthase glutaminase subunit PdxT [Demequina sp. PMTSA13]